MTLHDLLTAPGYSIIRDDLTRTPYHDISEPIYLSPEGLAHFAPVLSLPVSYLMETDCMDGREYRIVTIHLPEPNKARSLCKELIDSQAGFCTLRDFKRYFRPEETLYFQTQTGKVVSLSDVFREYIENGGDGCDFPEELERLLTPWEEALEELEELEELDPELDSKLGSSYELELGSYLLKLIREAELGELDYLLELIDGMHRSYELEHELEKQVELRRYKLTH